MTKNPLKSTLNKVINVCFLITIRVLLTVSQHDHWLQVGSIFGSFPIVYYDCAITVLTAETRSPENLIIPFYNLLLMTCNPHEMSKGIHGRDQGGWKLVKQRAKKVVSDSPGLVDFAIGLVNSVFNLPDGQVLFFGDIQITEGL